MVKMIGIKREMTMKRNVIIMAAISASLMMVSCAKNLTTDMEPESREDGKICYIDATIAISQDVSVGYLKISGKS